jgi:hypothetical protein
MAIKRTVVLRGEPEFNEYGAATEAIKPGYLVKGVSTVAKQTRTGKVPACVAVERSELGAGIDDTYLVTGDGAPAAAYASGDQVLVASFDAGDEATLRVASGQNVSEDSYLESAGDGTVRVAAAASITSGTFIATALETLGAVATETLVRVRFV